MSTVIRLDKVTKRYRLGSGVARLRDALAGAPPRAGAPDEQQPGTLEAVKDLCFEVGQGETLGIIGHNGAGKTTTLRMLCGVTRPSEGRIFCRGRVSALIELGAGFHPDLTGRENVYLNGSILGLTRREIDRQFDSIVSFSELEPFLDTPVKRYSSGMYVRLGFAVAVHTRPDILLVDEVLSVGDQAFQAKCLNRIGQMQRDGVTAVLVSHNMVVVRRHCSRVLLLEHGRSVATGAPEEILRLYQKRALADERRPGPMAGSTRNVTHRVQIEGLRILDSIGRPVAQARSDAPLRLVVEFSAREEVAEPVFEVTLLSRSFGGLLARVDNRMFDKSLGKIVPGRGAIEVTLDCVPLKNDLIHVSLAIFSSDYRELYDWREEAGVFAVHSADSGEGMVFVRAGWRQVGPPEDRRPARAGVVGAEGVPKAAAAAPDPSMEA